MAFPFEELYDDPPIKFEAGQRKKALMEMLVTRPLQSMKVWFGLVPYPHKHKSVKARGVYFTLKEKNGEWDLPGTPMAASTTRALGGR